MPTKKTEPPNPLNKRIYLFICGYLISFHDKISDKSFPHIFTYFSTYPHLMEEINLFILPIFSYGEINYILCFFGELLCDFSLTYKTSDTMRQSHGQ